MQIVGFGFLIVGLLQMVGAVSGSRLYQALPHFKRSERLFGHETAVRFHFVFGLVGTVVGLLILYGVISLPNPK